MGKSFDNHPRLMSIVAATSVIVAGLATMYILVFMKFPQNWIIILAPIPAAAVAGIFLYLGRSRSREASEEEISELLGNPETRGLAADGDQEIKENSVSYERIPSLEKPIANAPVDSNLLDSGDLGESAENLSQTVNQSTAEGSEMPAGPMSEEAGSGAMALPPITEQSQIDEAIQNVGNQDNFASEPQEILESVHAHDASVETGTEPVASVDKLMQELEKKIDPHAMVVTADTRQLAAEASASLTVVDRSKQQIARKIDQRCIVIAAPSHGVLQDRLNNWLSGGYGRVISASMAMNGKGFYLTLFYEPLEDNAS